MYAIKNNNIKKFSNNWPEKSSQKIIKKIENLSKKKKKINFFLTGGKTAAKLYPSLKKNLLPYKHYLKFYLTDDACLFQDMKTRIAPFTFFYVFPFVVTRLITNVVPLSLVKDGQRQAARPDPTNPVYVDTQLLHLDGSALIQVLYPPQKVRCIYTSTSTICCGGGGRKRGSKRLCQERCVRE